MIFFRKYKLWPDFPIFQCQSQETNQDVYGIQVKRSNKSRAQPVFRYLVEVEVEVFRLSDPTSAPS